MLDMRYTALFLALVFAISCGSPAANNAVATAPNNSAASPTAPTSALPPPSKEALLEQDRKLNEAFIKADASVFEEMLSNEFVSFLGGKRGTKGDELRIIAGGKCEAKSWTLDDAQMIMIDGDTAVVSYKSTVDGSCSSEKFPSPLRASTIWVRSGDAWRSAYHNETPIVDPATFVPPPPKPVEKQPAGKPIPAKTIDPNRVNEKQPELVPDQLTGVIAGIERSVWEAWKARDAAKLGSLMANEVAFVDAFGGYHGTKDAVIASWLGPTCQVSSVDVGTPNVTLISPTVAVLTFKGTAVGTCDGKPLTPLWETAVYKQEGSTWKLAFGFETPAS